MAVNSEVTAEGHDMSVAKCSCISSGSIPSVARRSGNSRVVGLTSRPSSKWIHPSRAGKCSYVLVEDPFRLDDELLLDRHLLSTNPITGLRAAASVEDDGDTGDGDDGLAGAISLSGLMDENRLEPRLEPLGGGLQVKLIFSN